MPTPVPISSLSPLPPPPLPSCYKAIILHLCLILLYYFRSYIILLLLLLLYLICRYNILNYFCHIGQILARCIYMRDIKISIYLSIYGTKLKNDCCSWRHLSILQCFAHEISTRGKFTCTNLLKTWHMAMVVVKRRKMEENPLSHSWEIYVTKPMSDSWDWFMSPIPWVAHGSEWMTVNSPKFNVSNLLYNVMGIVYVLSLKRVKPCPIVF